MKISKVNHSRTAVGEHYEKCSKAEMFGGFSYASPENKGLDLERLIIERTRNAQKLYAVLMAAKYDQYSSNEIKRLLSDDKKNKNEDENIEKRKGILKARAKLYKDIAEYFNGVMKELLKDSLDLGQQKKRLLDIAYSRWGILFEKVKKKWLKIKDADIPKKIENADGIEIESVEEMAEEMVSIGLFNQLRRKYSYMSDDHLISVDMQQMITEMLLAMCRGEMAGFAERYAGEKAEPDDEKVFCLFLERMNKSYAKLSDKTLDSLKQQSTKVQCKQAEDGEYLLQLANADHKKKKYLFQFMTDYAGATERGDKDKTYELLENFRKLVVLYYCGKEAYADAAIDDGFSGWSYGNVIPALKENIYLGMKRGETEQIDETQPCDESELPHVLWKKCQSMYKEGRQKRKDTDLLLKAIRRELINCYRHSNAVSITEQDQFWLGYISKCAENILLSGSILKMKEVKLNINFLCESTLRMFVSYIAEKFIDMGKAVYYFTKMEPDKDVDHPSIIGEVRPEFRRGISSFDYENIKAEESLDRNLSVYISFAACVWSHAVCDGMMADTTSESKSVKRYDDPYEENRRILQFFGGSSKWRNVSFEKGELYQEINERLRLLRNSRFHHTAKITQNAFNNAAACTALLKKEVEEAGDVYRKKYYSNNVWMFYTKENIRELMDFLYSGYKELPAQIPSFNKVISKTKLPDFMVRIIKGKKMKAVQKDLKTVELYRHALYFVLKEIFYYGFLQDKSWRKEDGKSCRDYFAEGLGMIKSKDKDEERALDDFKSRLNYDENHKKLRGDLSLTEICQRIMMDYNQQNQLKDKEAKEQEKYKHFPLLLCECMRYAFEYYIKDNLEFIREPQVLSQTLKEEEFLPGWTTELWSDVCGKINRDSELSAWYIVGHLLNQKYLNQLIGCFKTYDQYVQDIRRRAAATGNDKNGQFDRNKDKVSRNLEIIHILEFVKLYCGAVSQKPGDFISDYFKDDDGYNDCMSLFIDFSEYHDLKTFCEKTMISKESLSARRLYYNEQEPVVNRNLAYAMMYGNTELLSKTVQKVDERIIRSYYKQQENIQEYRKTGWCETADQQEDLKKYQNIKNQVELTDLVLYTEMVNEFMSQLVSWAYLRERDFMYFQLGMQYIMLHYGNPELPEAHAHKQKLFLENKLNIGAGAILYQINAMYSFHLPLYVPDAKGNIRPKAGMQTGLKIDLFAKSCTHGLEDYLAGMELFICPKKNVGTKDDDVVKIADRLNDEVVDFRNRVDHFHYFSDYKISILGMYSYIYDRFFSYNRNFKKSPSFVLTNILERYFIDARIKFSHGAGQTFDIDWNEKFKGLSSQQLTYPIYIEEKGKVMKNDSVKVDARNEEFLVNVHRILTYHEE